MADDGAAALRRALGAPPPDGVVAVLADDELADLADIVEEAQRHQREELAAAVKRGLGHIPFPLRLAIKKALR